MRAFTSIDEMVDAMMSEPLEDGIILSISPVDRIPFQVYEDAPEAQNNANTDANRRW